MEISIIQNLDLKDQGSIWYMTSVGSIEFIDSLVKFIPTEQVVRECKVRMVQQTTNSTTVASRREAISEVIVRPLQKEKAR